MAGDASGTRGTRMNLVAPTAFKGTMSPDQIQAVYAYVKGRAEKRITPGRPAKPGG